MNVLLNEKNEIIGCSIVGDIVDGLEIEPPKEIPEDFCENYSYINGQIVFVARTE